MITETLQRLFDARRGHFLLESGHHGDLWLDLETLCLRPSLLNPLVDELTQQLRPFAIQAVCGPLVEGAFLGLLVAERLDVEFLYTQPTPRTDATDLYGMAYPLPATLTSHVAGKRCAIVNDVINAGSAVRGTWEALSAHAAETVAVASLLVLGDTAESLAADWSTALIALDRWSNSIWTPDLCPLCASGSPLDNAW